MRLFRDETGREGVAKFIPMNDSRPTERELSIATYVHLEGVRNVVGVWDTGATEDSWVLVMPRASQSLHARIRELGGAIPIEEAIRILQDVAIALVDLEPRAVHRDLKPQNILKIGETWHVADFGLARLADDLTATVTWKGGRSKPYAAPETIAGRHQTIATDVYSFGVMAFEMLEGKLPFVGDDVLEQHLASKPPAMTVESAHLRALVGACMRKEPLSRPRPSQILQRLARASEKAPTPASRALAQANAKVAEAQAAAQAATARQTMTETRRLTQFDAADEDFKPILDALRDAIASDAPDAGIDDRPGNGRMAFVSQLGHGTLVLAQPMFVSPQWDGPFDVIATASISVQTQMMQQDYMGRSHSLWYCDAHRRGEFEWFELSFRNQFGNHNAHYPFALAPREAGQVFSNLAGSLALARPLTVIDHIDPDAFVNAWIDWFALAADGRLHMPSRLPEGDANAVENSFRPRWNPA